MTTEQPPPGESLGKGSSVTTSPNLLTTKPPLPPTDDEGQGDEVDIQTLQEVVQPQPRRSLDNQLPRLATRLSQGDDEKTVQTGPTPDDGAGPPVMRSTSVSRPGEPWGPPPSGYRGGLADAGGVGTLNDLAAQ